MAITIKEIADKNAWITAAEWAEKLKVNPRTIRRYYEAHKVYLRWERVGTGPLRIHLECEEVLKRIRELYDQKKRLEEVNRALAGEFKTYLHDDGEPILRSVTMASAATSLVGQNSLYKVIQEIEQRNAQFVEQLLERDREREQTFLQRERNLKDQIYQLNDRIVKLLEAKMEQKKDEEKTEETPKSPQGHRPSRSDLHKQKKKENKNGLFSNLKKRLWGG